MLCLIYNVMMIHNYYFKEWALAQQEAERTDKSFKRGCMFCRTEFCGSRIIYIKHLFQKHNLHLGKPDNLVFVDELLDKIQNNIERYYIQELHVILVLYAYKNIQYYTVFIYNFLV